MGIAIPMAVTVTPPELTGVMVWWGVMLATPALFIRRWRRRHGKARRRRRWPSAVRLRRASASPPSPDGLPSGTGTSGRLAAQPARPDDALRPSAGPLPAHRPPPPRGASQADCIAPGSVSDETLEPLSGYVDFHRRLELAVEELEYRLSRLRADRWRIEPYPLTGERRNTLLLLGECGVFVISTTYAPGHWDDVIAVNRLARKIQRLLPGYSGQVQAAVCHPFTATRPRIWYRPDEYGDWVGAWLIGGDSVIEWLEHFGPKHGLNTSDLARFDALARRNWLKGAIPTPPSWPPIRKAAGSDSEG